MSTKNISNLQVIQAYYECNRIKELLQLGYTQPYYGYSIFPYHLLKIWTGEYEKVCYRAMERAADCDYIEYGVSLRTGWLTEKAKSLKTELKGLV